MIDQKVSGTLPITDEDNVKKPLPLLPLFRCLYFNPETNYMALAKRSKQSFYLQNKPLKTINKEWNEYITKLKEKFEKYAAYLEK